MIQQAFSRLLSLVPVVLILVACSDPAPGLRPLGPDSVVLAFGDSLTWGTNAPRDESYPAVLASLTGLQVVNAGVPGEESSQGLKRLPGLLERHHPDLVILCHGGNDLLRKRDGARLRKNLEAMIGMIRARGADVVLVGVPTPGLILSTATLYREVADSTGIPLEDDVIADVLGTRDLKSDAIHPNARGYHALASALVSLLQANNAL